MARTQSDIGRALGNNAGRRAAPKAAPRSPQVLSVRHAVEILRCVASDPPLAGVSEIASVVGLHKSSVSRMIATLAEPFKETFVLREIQNLSYREIAETVGAPVGTVMSRLARARAMLRSAWLAEEEQPR